MAELTTRTTTTTVTGGIHHIILPDAGSPTGYTSYKITDVALKADINALISTNISGISTNSSAITVLQGITSRTQYTDQVSSFTFSQPADSRIKEIVFKSSAAATFLIGTTAGGSELHSGSLTAEYDYLASIEKSITDYYSESSRTIYFTITGTVSATIYYTLTEFN